MKKEYKVVHEYDYMILNYIKVSLCVEKKMEMHQNINTV